ncbi:hypothetical protein [Hymenobacter negativus]|uniref:Uncharacterized protein n=1 Tax=Hymenobacter negativus TaxID=2795026 RepID=A0ABS3QQU6_9BACT|nr:hypothetical protein [Hymenobacter negativus]MBO2013060.1 hypothetical protein [Hymenobacter negativus]
MGKATDANEGQTYSIQLRLRRVTYEDAYVSVILNDKVMQVQEDGTSKIDFEKFLAEAIRVSTTPNVDWQVESSQTEAHPLQAVRPDDRRVIDSFYFPDDQ